MSRGGSHEEDRVKEEGNEEKRDEKDAEYLVGSGNRRGIAGIRDWSRSGTGFAMRPGRPEPASGAAERQTEDPGGYTADAGRAGAGKCGRRCRVQSLFCRHSE